jgi:AcrR family transcriptional regulator
MNNNIAAPSEARKTPVQARSTATVEAIFEATIQVLLREGADRLTTTRVADRAGVSVGTLYQYYPNKQSLLFAVLERHLVQVMETIEHTCETHRHEPLEVMVRAVVHAYVDAKLNRAEASVALYSVASELGGQSLIAPLTKRARVAMASMLRTAPGVRFSQVEFIVFMLFSSMAGATRAVLEAGAPKKMVEDLRRHLVLLGEGYLNSATRQ